MKDSSREGVSWSRKYITNLQTFKQKTQDSSCQSICWRILRKFVNVLIVNCIDFPNRQIPKNVAKQRSYRSPQHPECWVWCFLWIKRGFRIRISRSLLINLSSSPIIRLVSSEWNAGLLEHFIPFALLRIPTSWCNELDKCRILNMCPLRTNKHHTVVLEFVYSHNHDMRYTSRVSRLSDPEFRVCKTLDPRSLYAS